MELCYWLFRYNHRAYNVLFIKEGVAVTEEHKPLTEEDYEYGPCLTCGTDHAALCSRSVRSAVMGALEDLEEDMNDHLCLEKRHSLEPMFSKQYVESLIASWFPVFFEDDEEVSR